MVNCEPHQRAVVRPTVVNGVAMSQVDCVAAAPAVAAPVAQPIAYTQPVAYRAPVTQVVQPVSSDLGDAQIVPVSTRTVQPVRTNQVVYDERPVRKTRIGGEERDHHRILGRCGRRRRRRHRRQEGRAHRRRDRRRRRGPLGPGDEAEVESPGLGVRDSGFGRAGSGAFGPELRRFLLRTPSPEP